MKIQKLPAEVRSKLQSGVLVTDAVQCVLELVHNSLDAGATGIAVRVNLKTYQIRVIDNGRGIGKDDLQFIGERCMTSKYQSFDQVNPMFITYGFRGQALSSVLNVSKSLTIESKTENGGPTFIKILKDKKSLPVIETKDDRTGTGTIVTVNDFMHSMPVRRKRISEVFVMEEIKTQLQYLAIIHYNVCFTLRNESKGLILLQTPQASSIFESISNLYGKAVAKSLKPLLYEEKNYEVTGFISMKPQTQSNLQLIYVNKRIISKGVIHKFINGLIKEYCGKKSLFGDSSANHILKKMQSLHNVFVILITCPPSFYVMFTNIRKVTIEFRNWKDALKCIHRAIKRTFKDVFNLSSFSSNQHCVNECKAENDKKGRSAFGTSLLVNAVRGIPAKRRGPNNRNKRKIKLNDSKEKLNVSLIKVMKNTNDSKKFSENSIKSTCQNELSNDSLESPIPKKSLKLTKPNSDLNSKKPGFNRSFGEFYEWLKVKFETDTNAFNLYNDFLQFKNNKIHSTEVAQIKSPVLGGKRKRKRMPNLKKKTMEKSSPMPTYSLSILDEEMAMVTQRRLTILPNQNLETRKAVQFSTEMNNKTLNSDHFGLAAFNFESHCSQLTKNAKDLALCSNNQRRLDHHHTLTSMPSSEVQFANIIKFRNMCESVTCPPDNHIQAFVANTSASSTWLSHYQNFSRNLVLSERDEHAGSLKSWMEINEALSDNRKLANFDFHNGSGAKLNLVKLTNARMGAVTQDAEIQVDLSGCLPQKINVMVQTIQEVTESPSFENSYTFIKENELFKENFEAKQPTERCLEESLILGVPDPDFWNSPTNLELEINDKNNKTTSFKSISEIDKNLTSNEFVSGHKSQLSTKVESTSKETQTLAAIWTDSLTRLEYPTANNPMSTAKESSQVSQPTTISKTIPIEEIEKNMTEQIESGFCMSERHDIVPKGFSPTFLNPEIIKVSCLNPCEKNKIKLTIDDTQNELLATIKWQNEATGDYIKPSIPDRILLEMHQKAGENVLNYENPVLSATLSYCAVKVHNLLHSFAFNKELLSGVEVLGQLDKKFIVTKMKLTAPKKMELISLFDQHAVDERIKLEELINENLSPEGKFVSTGVTPPIECELNESDLRVISDLREKMFDFGFKVQPADESKLFVYEIPVFLLKKHENDLKNKKGIFLSDAIRALILNILEEITEARGVVPKIPKVMHNAFCLEACHKAIRFNKPLSIEIMTEMISKLGGCKLPFQCAHGRPSVIPIIDLEDFKSTIEENENIVLKNFKNFFNKIKDVVGKNSETA